MPMKQLIHKVSCFLAVPFILFTLFVVYAYTLFGTTFVSVEIFFAGVASVFLLVVVYVATE